MSDLQFICALLESEYIKVMKKKDRDVDIHDLFPITWYTYEDYEAKIKFLNRAIKEKRPLYELYELDGSGAITATDKKVDDVTILTIE